MEPYYIGPFWNPIEIGLSPTTRPSRATRLKAKAKKKKAKKAKR